jgi:hypothetical protein
VIICLLALVQTEVPAEKYNLSGQHRTRTCVAMKGRFVPLRFADGTPTGFWAAADDPSQQGSADPCAPGTMEIDAHESLRSADRLVTFFHTGGGPDQYLKNHVENGQYGHVARDDLQGAIKLEPTPTGKSAPARLGRSYFITPTRIPMDMWYKPNAAAGRSGARYYTYGNPGYDKTYGRGDWTYISWSWVQTGGREIAANGFGGGGIARGLLKRGMRLMACDVKPILGLSFGPDNKENGRVTAIYGRVFAGPGEGGSPLHGWLPHSYQRNDDLIVPCLRRTPEAQAVPLPLAQLKSDEPDRMTRMALNLLNELEADQAAAQRGLAYWNKKYAAEDDPLARMELLTEMSRIDRPGTVAAMLKMAAGESDSRVREQAIVLVGYMRSTDAYMEPVCRAFGKLFANSKSERERVRILDVVSNVPCGESVGLLREVLPTLGPPEEDVELRFAAADAVMKLSLQMEVDGRLSEEVLDPLRQLARGAKSRSLRARAIRALGAPARKQLAFLLTLVETERSEAVREALVDVTGTLQRGN